MRHVTWVLALWLALGASGAPIEAAGRQVARNAGDDCPGDLDGDGMVTVAEIVSAVQRALTGCDPVPDCPGDLDGDGTVTVAELLTIVNAALRGCDAEPVWSWCPSASEYVGQSGWTHELRATGRALYCGMADEARTLEEELPAKAQLRVVEGTYPLPDQDGAFEFALPVCLGMADGAEPPLMDGAGEISASLDGYRSVLTQPLATAAGDPWTLESWLSLDGTPGEPAEPLLLDGSAPDPFFGAGYNLMLCPGEECHTVADIRFGSCNPATYELQRHTVTFEGGQVVLDVRIGESTASTEPSAFVAALGTLDGEPFEQSDYWKLVYNPEHHHFSRDFAVLFDDPISGACGLKLRNLDPWSEPPAATVHTVDCQLQELEQRPVTDERFERL